MSTHERVYPTARQYLEGVPLQTKKSLGLDTDIMSGESIIFAVQLEIENGCNAALTALEDGGFDLDRQLREDDIECTITRGIVFGAILSAIYTFNSNNIVTGELAATTVRYEAKKLGVRM